MVLRALCARTEIRSYCLRLTDLVGSVCFLMWTARARDSHLDGIP